MQSLELKLGIYDDPDNQCKDIYKIDLLKSHLAVVGVSRSGKTTILKNIILAIHHELKESYEEEIYILDFSNNLKHFDELPYVTAYLDSFHEENIRRVFRAIEECYDRNIKALPGTAYNKYELPSDKENPKHARHITFIIDGVDSFLSEDKYASYHDIFKKIIRDGISKGVSVVFTSTGTEHGLINLISSYVHTIIALGQSKEQLSQLFNQKLAPTIQRQGRCWATMEREIREVQLFYPHNTINENEKAIDTESINKIVESFEGNDENKSLLNYCKNKKLKSFTGDLEVSSWKQYGIMEWTEYVDKRDKFDGDKSLVTIGMDYYDFTPIELDLLTARSIAIYGKKSSGKSNVLSLILERAEKIEGVNFVFWDDGRHALTKNAGAVGDFIERNKNKCEVYSGKWSEFFFHLIENGYADIPDYYKRAANFDQDFKERINELERIIKSPKNKFTVFVIQSRLFYPANDDYDPKGDSISDFDYLINKDSYNKIILFSDVQRLPGKTHRSAFNTYVDHAILLDDILPFVRDRGAGSVFGSLDMDYIKDKYGKCDLGEGFYLDVNSGEDRKIKILHNTRKQIST